MFVYAPPVRGPAFYRRGGVEGLQARIDAGELEPDFGPARIDPAVGGVIVGARRPLIAFNVNLRGSLEAAKEIADAVRERTGGFPGVRALGLDLPEAGHVQVSMNVEDWEAAALHEIVERIADEAEQRGAEVAGSELVGLMPAGRCGRGGGSDAADRGLRRVAPARAAAARRLTGDALARAVDGALGEARRLFAVELDDLLEDGSRLGPLAGPFEPQPGVVEAARGAGAHLGIGVVAETGEDLLVLLDRPRVAAVLLQRDAGAEQGRRDQRAERRVSSSP